MTDSDMANTKEMFQAVNGKVTLLHEHLILVDKRVSKQEESGSDIIKKNSEKLEKINDQISRMQRYQDEDHQTIKELTRQLRDTSSVVAALQNRIVALEATAAVSTSKKKNTSKRNSSPSASNGKTKGSSSGGGGGGSGSNSGYNRQKEGVERIAQLELERIGQLEVERIAQLGAERAAQLEVAGENTAGISLVSSPSGTLLPESRNSEAESELIDVVGGKRKAPPGKSGASVITGVLSVASPTANGHVENDNNNGGGGEGSSTEDDGASMGGDIKRQIISSSTAESPVVGGGGGGAASFLPPPPPPLPVAVEGQRLKEKQLSRRAWGGNFIQGLFVRMDEDATRDIANLGTHEAMMYEVTKDNPRLYRRKIQALFAQPSFREAVGFNRYKKDGHDIDAEGVRSMFSKLVEDIRCMKETRFKYGGNHYDCYFFR